VTVLLVLALILSLISQGFNRGDNNQTNTYLAVVEAKERALNHLWAVELGNEPDGMEALAALPWHIKI
jgi:hypothetical protein